MSKINCAQIHAWRQDQQIHAQLLGHELQFKTTWGLFSPKQIDAGSRLLLEHIQIDPMDQVLDLGCGYGVLGLSIAAYAPSTYCTLVDKDFVAVEYARKNAALNGLNNVQVQLSNGLDQLPPEQKFSLVVSNLPAKTGNEQYYLFFCDIYQRLPSGGRFYVVVINGLRPFIARSFKQIFGFHRKIKQSKQYTVALAIKERQTE